MKKIIPISKEITFRTMIGEMTEVSLENTLTLTSEYSIEGNIIVKGHYKMTEASAIEEDFEEAIPVTIDLDEKYDTSGVEVTIDDFYYEIINEDRLRIHLEIAVDGLVEKIAEIILPEEESPIESVLITADNSERDSSELLDYDEIPEVSEEVMPVNSEKVEEVIPVMDHSKELLNESNINESNMNSIFTALENTEETFSTYYVYIVRENDTVDSIIEKYKTTRELLADYNNLDEIKLGTKLIIPCSTKDESN